MPEKKQLAYWEEQIKRNARIKLVDRLILAAVMGLLSGLLIYVVIDTMKQTGLLQ